MEALLTSTLTVALAEIGDKTQLLSLLLAVRFHNKPAIILGILVATLLNHAASAWFGTWLGQYLQSDWGNWLIGGSFIALGLWLLVPDKADAEDHRFDHYGAFAVSTVLFFLAEIGDKTQIATIALAAEFQSILWVTLGTTLGMLAANVPVVYAGNALMSRIPFQGVRILAAAVFCGFGIWMVLQ